jgi:cell division septum initiation protein DivIVA
VSLGSGLRTGVTVVDHAIRFSSELGEARERAREAQQEAARLEAELAEAEAAARRDELRSEAEDGASSSTASSPSASSPGASSGPPEESTRQTIVAAVAAGQSGEEPPRGAFVDFSV